MLCNECPTVQVDKYGSRTTKSKSFKKEVEFREFSTSWFNHFAELKL